MKKRTSPERWLYRIVGRFVPDLKETWLRGQQIGGSWRHSLHITPALVCTPWHKSCLATIDDLGITTHSITIGVEWMRWYWCLTFGVSTQKPRPIPGTVEYDEETELMQEAADAMRNLPLVSPNVSDEPRSP